MTYPQRPPETRRAEVIKEVLAVLVGLIGLGMIALALINAIGWVLLTLAGSLVLTLALMIVARPDPEQPRVDEPS